MSSCPTGIIGEVAFATAASNARDSRDDQNPTMAHEPWSRRGAGRVTCLCRTRDLLGPCQIGGGIAARHGHWCVVGPPIAWPHSGIRVGGEFGLLLTTTTA